MPCQPRRHRACAADIAEISRSRKFSFREPSPKKPGGITAPGTFSNPSGTANIPSPMHLPRDGYRSTAIGCTTMIGFSSTGSGPVAPRFRAARRCAVLAAVASDATRTTTTGEAVALVDDGPERRSRVLGVVFRRVSRLRGKQNLRQFLGGGDIASRLLVGGILAGFQYQILKRNRSSENRRRWTRSAIRRRSGSFRNGRRRRPPCCKHRNQRCEVPRPRSRPRPNLLCQATLRAGNPVRPKAHWPAPDWRCRTPARTRSCRRSTRAAPDYLAAGAP